MSLADEYDLDEWLRPEPLPYELEIDKENNLRLWKDTTDWSHVERLELANVDLLTFYREIGGKELGRLKHHVVEAAENFLPQLPQLESLRLHGFTGNANAEKLLARHGPNLTHREFREWESENIFEKRAVLSPADLIKIQSLYPGLEKLSIDVNRNGSWPLETTDTLFGFESLRHLMLKSELGIDQHVDESSD